MKIIAVMLVFVASALTTSTIVSAMAGHRVGQKNKAFSVEHLVINKGETVTFENDDPFHHNVFSLSDAKTFDLGSYGQGDSRDVTFEQAGEVEVECAIHPRMHMTIVVEE